MGCSGITIGYKDHLLAGATPAMAGKYLRSLQDTKPNVGKGIFMQL
jgi:hypothetical protein